MTEVARCTWLHVAFLLGNLNFSHWKRRKEFSKNVKLTFWVYKEKQDWLKSMQSDLSLISYRWYNFFVYFSIQKWDYHQGETKQHVYVNWQTNIPRANLNLIKTDFKQTMFANQLTLKKKMSSIPIKIFKKYT